MVMVTVKLSPDSSTFKERKLRKVKVTLIPYDNFSKFVFCTFELAGEIDGRWKKKKTKEKEN